MNRFNPQIEHVLDECRALDSAMVNGKRKNSFWIIDDRVGRYLNEVTRSMNAKKVLEIGTSIGYSTMFFAEAVAACDGIVFSIESNAQRIELASSHIERAGLGESVHLIQTHAPEHIPLIDPRTGESLEGELDIVFLDCIKKYYKECYEITKPLIKSGGMIIADNILSHPDALSDFVEAINDDPDFEVEIKDMGTGLLLARKQKTF